MRGLRRNIDWILLGLVILTGVVTAIVLNMRPERSNLDIPYADRGNVVSQDRQLGALDPNYPSPGGTEREYLRTYTEGKVQYSLERLVLNPSRNTTLSRPSFRVRWLNTTNTTLPHSINFSCVAHADPYRVVAAQVLYSELSPLENKVEDVSVDHSCVYVGTADKKYFWRVY